MKNKRLRTILKFLIGTAMALLAIVWAIWLVAIPESLISSRMDGAIQSAGLRAEYNDFGKGVFYNLKASGLTLFRQDQDIVHMDDINVRLILNPLHLLRLRPAAAFSATMAEGKIEGIAMAHGSKLVDLDLSVRGLRLAEMGIDRLLTGLSAAGKADLDASLVNGAGEIRFSVTEMDFLPYKYMGFALPLDLLERSRGIILIHGKRVEIKSATFEGRGLYARLTGEMDNDRANLSLELMPSREIEESLPYFKMIEQYRTTSGHYTVPIRTGY